MPMIGFPDLQWHIRIDEKGGRRPVDPDILQTRQRQHVQVSRNTRIRRIIVTQRHKILDLAASRNCARAPVRPVTKRIISRRYLFIYQETE